MLMKKKLFAYGALAMALAVGAARVNESAAQSAAVPQIGAWGFDLTGVDPKAKPGDSFFDYANGAWDARTVIPPDKARFGSFNALGDKTEDQVYAIISDAAKSGAAPTTDVGKIGAIFNAFMDEAKIEQRDVAPITDDLAKIRDAKTKTDIAALMGNSRGGRFGGSFFAVWVDEDQKDPTRHALYGAQSGLGLPDRDYYLKDAFKDKKEKYHGYVARMLDMIGWPDASKRADEIVALETRIADASWSRAESRDAEKTYNPRTLAELEAYAPGFSWSTFLTAAQVGDARRIVVGQLTAFPKLATIFAETPLDTLQAWQAFRVADQAAPYLSKRFVEARFEFRDKELGGQLEDRPRAKRGIRLVNSSIGQLVGKEYVARYFPPASKAQMEELVSQLRRALHERIEHLPWMSAETKAKALEKLSLFGVKIGYPNKWRDYSALTVDPTDLVANLRRSSEFKWAYEVNKLTKPVDPEEWGATPQTVNAYYSSTRNEIVFPAGILQAPFFDPNADRAINYGAIGGVIGHELTHGFDDQGRKSDGHGMLTDWWLPADAAKFQAEAARYGAQYDSYSVAPGVHVNGALTMGENIADLGGLLLALDAYRASLGGKPAPVLDGFTGDQRVFLGWAQVWRDKSRPDALKRQVTSDPHSPARFRIDGPMRNIDAWYDAWGVKPDDKLYLKPEERVRIW
jgi:putative endopeptidase